eukprot:CAMPEP_0197027774 /NCGR_PEP_ID=MMETSP1384-20130603/7651_1 /TAXON_ID=29189 /ORGANISM="Ammonia sp." /LENGTH=928 /DNA_ID=CAMNT_0042456677 /DNA_START=52 /DNA_END=2838 /DNA_ORIENTATION=-
MITLTNHCIEASISDRYASIDYLYNFENTSNGSSSSELKFEITIDPEAFISHFVADIDGELFYGKTKEQQEAKKQYDEAKKKDENAILISKPYKDISNVFRIKTNIDAQSKVSLRITIQQYLTKKFHFNQLNIQILRNFEKYNIVRAFEHIAFKFELKDKSGLFDISIPCSLSSSSLLANSDDIKVHKQVMNEANTQCTISGTIHGEESSVNELVLKYKVKGEQADSVLLFDRASRTFCHIISDIISDSMVEAQVQQHDVEEGGGDDDDKHGNKYLIPRRVVFVIDKSGSMAGSRWNKTVSATAMALQQLRVYYDRYGLIFFDDSIKLVTQSVVIANEQNVNESVQALQSENAGGSTNINDALLKAIELIKRDIVSLNQEADAEDDVNGKKYNFFMNQIIFITDGEPNRGESDTKRIIVNVKNANDLQDIDKYSSKINIFSFGVGKDANDSAWINDLNHSFLKSLSVNNNGLYQRIKHTTIDRTLTEYYQILSKPVLSNIRVQYDDDLVHDLTQTRFNTLYYGNDLIVCGQMKRMKHDENAADGEAKYNEEDEQKQHDIPFTATISAITGKQLKSSQQALVKVSKPINISKRIKIGVDSAQNNSNVERIWAYLKLQDYAKQKIMYDDMLEIDDDEKKESDAVPLSLAMKYRFVTPWTSMVVVKKKNRIFEDTQAEYGELLSGDREHKIKLITVGDANCGKTSLIVRFVENVFDANNAEVTMNVNCKNKKLRVNEKYFNVSLWDTVGQERHSQSLAPIYMRNANGVVFVCDINNKQSIANIAKWVQSVNQTIHFDKNNAILVVNKSDLQHGTKDGDGDDEDEQGAMDMIKELTSNLGIDYVVTSAKDNINVKQSFYKLIESIYDTTFGANEQNEQNNNNADSKGFADGFDRFRFLSRGEQIDNLAERSEMLSSESVMFTRAARKSSACC